MRLSVPRLLLLACALLVVLPAGANAASSKKGVGYPVIKKVSPLKLNIGGTLTITGKNFRKGKGKNTVVFKRSGKPAVFAKSASSTTTKITVVVPAKLTSFLSKKNGAAVATRFQLRVLAKRFSKSFTSNKLSPVISPKKAGGTGGAPTPPTPYQTCQAGVKANPGADSDADGLVNATETAIGTDPCNTDSDGDGMVDGYEYDSALDLNGRALPYPGKRPWPNPLDPSDGNSDFDGDGLSLLQEYKLWKFVGGTFPVTAYSDGTQNSGGTMPTVSLALQHLDLDRDNNLTDDERDADNDGLSNVVEYQFRGTQDWWTAVYNNEKPFGARMFAGVDPTVWDSDGDGVADGADDQDQDGYSNYIEMEVSRAQQNLRVQPYNPCLPDPYSPTCRRYVPISEAWPPFDGSQDPGDPIPFTLDGNPPPNWDFRVWNGDNGGPKGS
ncbi:MAG TPA: IPT/TIG domain-containing protein [Solirubrobacteraceae bacterium]